MEGQSGELAWKKRKYGGNGTEPDELPPFEEVEEGGPADRGRDTNRYDVYKEFERDRTQPVASTSTSTSKPSDSLPFSNPPASLPQSRLSRFSSQPHQYIPSASASRASTSLSSPFVTASSTFQSSRRRPPVDASVLFGESADRTNYKPATPSRQIPLTSEQSKLFNKTKSTAPLRVYSKPSTGGLVAAGGLGPSYNGSSNLVEKKDEKERKERKERIEKKEERDSAEEHWMDLDDVSVASRDGSEGVQDEPDETVEDVMEKIDSQFHGRPRSPSDESSSSGNPQEAQALEQPRPLMRARAAKKSAKVPRLTREESEGEWEDEENGSDSQEEGMSDVQGQGGESDGAEEAADEETEASDGGSEAEVQSRLVPQRTRQTPSPVHHSSSWIRKNSASKTELTAPIRQHTHKAPPAQLQPAPLKKSARKSAPNSSTPHHAQNEPSAPTTSSSRPSQSPEINVPDAQDVDEEIRAETASPTSSITSETNRQADLDPQPSKPDLDEEEEAGRSKDQIPEGGTPELVGPEKEEEAAPAENLDDGQSSDLSQLPSPASTSFVQVGTSERMLRTRSSEGKAQKLEPPLRQVSFVTSSKSLRGRNRENGTEKKKWVDLLKIDQGKRVEVPADWKTPPHPWQVEDAEDSINECIHDKQLLITLDKVVLSSTSASSYDLSRVVLNLSIDAKNSVHGFPPTLSLATRSFTCSLILDKATEYFEPTFRLDPDDPLTWKPISLPFSPLVCRKAGTISLSVSISLQFGSAQLDTRHVLCSVSSPAQPLIPRPCAPLLYFDEPDSNSAISIVIDVVPLRKQITSAEEGRIEIARRLARIELDRERIWVPDAQAIREGEVEKKMPEMLNLGPGVVSYDFSTKLPYRPGEPVRNFKYATVENTARFVETKDEEIDQTTVSASEKLLARAHMRWGLLNPYPPSIFDREITCWIHYAPLVYRFSLREELVSLLLTHFLKYRLLNEREIRSILSKYDIEKKKIEKGERMEYEEMRREALWLREQREKR